MDLIKINRLKLHTWLNFIAKLNIKFFNKLFYVLNNTIDIIDMINKP